MKTCSIFIGSNPALSLEVQSEFLDEPEGPRIFGCSKVEVHESGGVTLYFKGSISEFTVYAAELDALHAASLAARKEGK